MQTINNNLVEVHFYHLILLGTKATALAQRQALTRQFEKDGILHHMKENIAGNTSINDTKNIDLERVQCVGDAWFLLHTLHYHIFQFGYFCFSHFCSGINCPQLIFAAHNSAFHNLVLA